MSTTLSMWLGISFVALGIGSTVLQAWLWSFPMEPDPDGPDPNGKSTAPKLWTRVHRFMGLAFVIIYIVLMAEMIPRLWTYQVELPARTVMHATMGIIIGVLLVVKISIIRWFQHFGKSLPGIGVSILACTLVLATLSIPYALRAHDFGHAGSPDNLDRVGRILSGLETREQDKVDPIVLANEKVLRHGQRVLTQQCVACHDMRTILKKPRTGQQWYDVVVRMQGKPTFGRPLQDVQIGPVTAYLIAITPDLQESKKLKRKEEQDRKKAAKEVHQVTDATPGVEEGAPPAEDEFDMDKAKEVFEVACAECHDLSDTLDYGDQPRSEWTEVVERMVDENEAELSKEETVLIIEYLMRTQGSDS